MPWKSGKQRAAVMAMLRNSGLLEKLMAKKPRGVIPGVISSHHVNSFHALLKKGHSIEEAVGVSRVGGIFPFPSIALQKKLSTSSSRFKDFPPDMPLVRVVAGEEGELLLNMHPLLVKIRGANPKGAMEVDNWMRSWGAASVDPGAFSLRVAVQKLFPNYPRTRLSRLEKKQNLRDEIRYMRGLKKMGVPADKSFEKSIQRAFPEKYSLGTSSEAVSYLEDLYATQQYISQGGSGTATLYRGIRGKQAQRVLASLERDGVAVLDADMLSSWSSSKKVATGFTGLGLSDTGVLIHLPIDKRRILTSHRLIKTSGDAQESIVIGDRFFLLPEDVQRLGT